MRKLLIVMASFAVSASDAVAAPARAAACEDDARRIAITVDDLPWAHLRRGAAAHDATYAQHARLVAAIAHERAPVVGFVNEDKLEGPAGIERSRVAMLEAWLEAGAELGNHTYGHVDLHAAGLDAYRRAILDGERETRRLLAARGVEPRWFRHPYLRAGRTDDERAGLAAFLAEHGYRIAPVTLDNSEWIWAGAYRRVLEGEAGAGARDATLARLRKDYAAYMIDKTAYYEAQSCALLGRLPAQVLLIHANALNADAYGALLEAHRARGYEFVTLESALEDPAYDHEDGYRGAYGPSWIHRWAIAAGKPRGFFAGEPETPRWVLELAGVDSE